MHLAEQQPQECRQRRSRFPSERRLHYRCQKVGKDCWNQERRYRAQQSESSNPADEQPPSLTVERPPQGRWPEEIGHVRLDHQERQRASSGQIVSAADGRKLAEHRLDSPPVFDGMVAAGARLYVSTLDGNVVCFGGR